MKLLDLFVKSAEKFRARNAAIFCDVGRKDVVFTYNDLDQIASEISNFLKTLASGKSGKQKIVGLYMPVSGHYVSCVIGVLKTGWIFAPFDPLATNLWNCELLEIIGCDYVIVANNGSEKFREIVSAFKHISEVKIEEISDNIFKKLNLSIWQIQKTEPNIEYNELTFCYAIATSGTTGKPKVVLISNESIVPNILDFLRIFKIECNYTVAMVTAPTFDPSIIEMFVSMAAGACLVIPSQTVKMVPQKLCDVLFVHNKTSVLQTTPSLFKILNDSKKRNAMIFGAKSSLRIVAFGGEDCPSAKQIKDMMPNFSKTQIRFFNLYGVTEVSVWASYHEILWTDIKNGSDSQIEIGNPLSETELVIHVLDSDDVFAINSKYEIYNAKNSKLMALQTMYGRLCIKSQFRKCAVKQSSHEFNLSEEIDTGDLVRTVISDNEVKLYFEGRNDGLIKRNGKRVNLHMINNAIAALQEVQSCTVWYDKQEQNQIGLIIACVIRTSSFSDCEHFPNHIKLCLTKSSLPSHCIPDKIIEMKMFPLTCHGKVDKKEIVRQCRNNCCETNEKQIDVDLFVKNSISNILFGRKYVEYKGEKFLNVGGDSLKAVQLLNVISDNVNISELRIDFMTLLFTEKLCNFVQVITNCKLKKTDNDQLLNHNQIHDGIIQTKRFLKQNLLINDAKKKKLSPQRTSFSLQWKFDTGKCVDASPLLFQVDDRLLCCIGMYIVIVFDLIILLH